MSDELPPISLEEKRTENASTWRTRSVRATLLSLLRRIDSGEIDLRACAVVSEDSVANEDGIRTLRFTYGGDVSNTNMIGMVAHMQHDLANL